MQILNFLTRSWWRLKRLRFLDSKYKHLNCHYGCNELISQVWYHRYHWYHRIDISGSAMYVLQLSDLVRPFHKKMIHWILISFFTSIRLSCLLACQIAAYILRPCLRVGLCFVYVCLCSQRAFWTKTNKIYKREFSCVSKKTSLLLEPRTSTRKHNKQTRKENSPVHPQNDWKKEKRKTTGVVMQYALTPIRKNSRRFLKTSVF